MVVRRESSQHLAGALRRAPLASDPWARLLDTSSLEAARTSRDVASWERRADVESATWSGLLIDAMEGAHTVSIRTRFGQPLIGAIRGVGIDAVALLHDTELIVLALSSIAAIESLHESLDADSERTASSFSLQSCVRRATEERADVVLTLAACGQVIVGRLRSCGVDVCTLAPFEHSRKRIHLAVSAVAMMRIRP